MRWESELKRLQRPSQEKTDVLVTKDANRDTVVNKFNSLRREFRKETKKVMN
jgi:hypothetical protein